MKKYFLGIGLILIVIFGVMIGLYATLQNTNKSYEKVLDFAYSGTKLPYDEQTYWMTDTLSFQAKTGDTVLITNSLARGNSGNWATVFIMGHDPNDLNIPTILTFDAHGNPGYTASVGTGYNLYTYPSYSKVIGSVLPCNNNGYAESYNVRLGVVTNFPTNNNNNTMKTEIAGAYNVTINVTSKSSNQAYLILALLFLIIGFAAIIIGLVLKPRSLMKLQSN